MSFITVRHIRESRYLAVIFWAIGAGFGTSKPLIRIEIKTPHGLVLPAALDSHPNYASSFHFRTVWLSIAIEIV